MAPIFVTDSLHKNANYYTTKHIEQSNQTIELSDLINLQIFFNKKMEEGAYYL